MPSHHIPSRELSNQINQLLKEYLATHTDPKPTAVQLLDLIFDKFEFPMKVPTLYQRLHRLGLSVPAMYTQRRGPSVVKPRKEPDVVCIYPGCNRLRRWGGLCTGHHDRATGKIPADKPLRVENQGHQCAVTGCGRPADCKGLCYTHYERKRAKDPRWDAPIQQRLTGPVAAINIGNLRLPAPVLDFFNQQREARAMKVAELVREIFKLWYLERHQTEG